MNDRVRPFRSQFDVWRKLFCEAMGSNPMDFIVRSGHVSLRQLAASLPVLLHSVSPLTRADEFWQLPGKIRKLTTLAESAYKTAEGNDFRIVQETLEQLAREWQALKDDEQRVGVLFNSGAPEAMAF